MYNNKMRNDVDKLTCEMLVDAFIESNGLIHKAKKLLQRDHNIQVSVAEIKRAVTAWGMEDFLQEIRSGMVESCFDTTYNKALGGDNQSLFYIQEKFGHHLDFLPEKESSDTDSHKGWKEILENIKRPFK